MHGFAFSSTEVLTAAAPRPIVVAREVNAQGTKEL
jgi:hypothetical protein